MQTSSIERTKYYAIVADCSSLNEPEWGVGVAGEFYVHCWQQRYGEILQLWAGAACALLSTLFYDIFNLSLYQSFLWHSPGPPVLIFSFSHTFLVQ